MKKFILPVLIIVILLVYPVSADDLSRSRQQLDQIRARIEKAEADLQAQRQVEINIGRDLALIEGQLQQADQRIRQITGQQQRLRTDMQNQQQAINQSEGAVRNASQQLEKRLAALYKEGDAGLLRILFSAETPTEMAQQYHYLTRVMENDARLIGEYRQAIAHQRQRVQELMDLQNQQARLLEQERQQREAVTATRTLQTRLLRQAQADNKKLHQELQQLAEDARQLSALVEELQRRPPPAPPVPSDIADFGRSRGQLPWPVEGAILIRFGTQRDTKLGTLYESNGIEIATPVRSDIVAVARGQVVYADYFKGYGNLIIVSHQGEYHTLYAQLERLRKKTGDQVATGEVIGSSGLAGRESIYFEVRHKGAPVNPLDWLKRL